MSKLCDIFGVKPVAGPLIGVEIECEGKNLVEIRGSKFWQSTQDGSLRGNYPDEAIEYVSKVPIRLPKLFDAMDELNAALVDATVDDSFRTSVHVHVNCSDLDEKQVFSFLFTYYLLERALMKYCGEDRNNNRFCLRAVDCDQLVMNVDHLIQNGIRYVPQFVNNDLRYGAANLASIPKYGTIEFRGMRGTVEKEVIMNWSRMLLRVREYATQPDKDPFCIFEEAVKDPEEFVKNVLKVDHQIIFDENTVSSVNEALSLCVVIPFSWKNRMEKERELERARQELVKRALKKAEGARPGPDLDGGQIVFDHRGAGIVQEGLAARQRPLADVLLARQMEAAQFFEAARREADRANHDDPEGLNF